MTDDSNESFVTFPPFSLFEWPVITESNHDLSSLDKDMKRFFKLFKKSTLEGSRVAALETRKITKRQTKDHQKFCCYSVCIFLFAHPTLICFMAKQSASGAASGR
jgi:hypothetical protein